MLNLGKTSGGLHKKKLLDWIMLDPQNPRQTWDNFEFAVLDRFDL